MCINVLEANLKDESFKKPPAFTRGSHLPAVTALGPSAFSHCRLDRMVASTTARFDPFDSFDRSTIKRADRPEAAVGKRFLRVAGTVSVRPSKRKRSRPMRQHECA